MLGARHDDPVHVMRALERTERQTQHPLYVDVESTATEPVPHSGCTATYTVQSFAIGAIDQLPLLVETNRVTITTGFDSEYTGGTDRQVIDVDALGQEAVDEVKGGVGVQKLAQGASHRDDGSGIVVHGPLTGH